MKREWLAVMRDAAVPRRYRLRVQERLLVLEYAAAKGVRPLAWFANATPLRSGWAWGQSYLDGAVEAVEAPIGKGTLFLFAPEITFRGQPHGTFKWLFNGIYAPKDQAMVP